MKIFDAQTGELVRNLGSNWDEPYQAQWSPDGTMIATPEGWTGAFLNIWSVDGERLDTYWGGRSVAWSPDSTQLASDTQIREIATGLPIVIIPDLDGDIVWHPTEDWIAGNGKDGIALWNAVTGKFITEWTFTNCRHRGFTWSNDGHYFAVNCLTLEPEYSNDLILAEVVIK